MNRLQIQVMHGVNLNMLGVRNPEHYGTITFTELELQIDRYARELGIDVTHYQTNFEGEFIEQLHRVRDLADGLILNPGAWTHYAWAIHDALEMVNLPAVEVHMSDIYNREEWRKHSVVSDLCIATVAGKGVEGYREALELLLANNAKSV